MLLRRGQDPDFVKVLDFGLARIFDEQGDLAGTAISMSPLTKDGLVFGTPEYMSPEQACGGKVGPQSDVYALGAVLYEMVTGSVPFSGRTFTDILSRHVRETPVPPVARCPAARHRARPRPAHPRVHGEGACPAAARRGRRGRAARRAGRRVGAWVAARGDGDRRVGDGGAGRRPRGAGGAGAVGGDARPDAGSRPVGARCGCSGTDGGSAPTGTPCARCVRADHADVAEHSIERPASHPPPGGRRRRSRGRDRRRRAAIVDRRGRRAGRHFDGHAGGCPRGRPRRPRRPGRRYRPVPSRGARASGSARSRTGDGPGTAGTCRRRAGRRVFNRLRARRASRPPDRQPDEGRQARARRRGRSPRREVPAAAGRGRRGPPPRSGQSPGPAPDG